MPVTTTFSGRGVLEESHPLSFGLLGNMGTSAAKRAIQDAEVILLIGFKLGQNFTFNRTLPRSDQTVIHLDVDHAEVGKVFPTEIISVGDAKLGLAALIEAVKSAEGGRQKANDQRLGWMKGSREAWQQETVTDLTSDEAPIKPQQVMQELNHWHSIYFDGTGEPFSWGDTDFATVGKGFGCLGIRVQKPR